MRNVLALNTAPACEYSLDNIIFCIKCQHCRDSCTPPSHNSSPLCISVWRICECRWEGQREVEREEEEGPVGKCTQAVVPRLHVYCVLARGGYRMYATVTTCTERLAHMHATHILAVQEGERQRTGLELIASENFTSKAVMEVMGSCLTNKVRI